MNDTKVLAVRVPAEIATAIQGQARQELISTSAFIRRTLAMAVTETPRQRFEREQTSFG